MRDRARDALREYATSERPSLLDELAREARARHGDHVAVDVGAYSAAIVDAQSQKTHAREIGMDTRAAMRKLCVRLVPARGERS